MADTAPLARLLELYVDEAMVAEVAAQHKKGRRFIIGTTQLDAQRLVIWDIGTIATSGHPDTMKKIIPQDHAGFRLHSRRFPAPVHQSGGRRRLL